MAEKNTSLSAPAQGPNVSFVRKELQNLKEQYELISDCLEGSKKIKRETTKYLPKPSEVDEDDASRYEAYLKRAVFYNVTKRTLSGLLGQIFLRKPVVEIPTTLDPLKDNASGSGVTLDQLASMTAGEDISFGRAGLFVDYPKTDAPATQKDILEGKVRPSILFYKSKDIINWRTEFKNGKEMLSLVVLFESRVENDDGFEQTYLEQLRVLRLVEGLYEVHLYVKASTQYELTEVFTPTDAKGARLTEIPFTFVGVNNNDANIDEPPLYDLAELNVAHYRNSADYEEACFICGQPTPALSGLTEDWVKNVMKGKVVLGSRSAIMLPVGGTAELIQAEANTMPKEAMEAKERQMVALGAKLVQEKSVQRTATEAGFENTAEISVLASIAKNVENAITACLKWSAIFVGAEAANIKYKLNSEFDLTQLTSLDRSQLLSELQGGGITFKEYRENLRRAGIATLDDKDAIAELKQNETDGIGRTPPIDPNQLLKVNSGKKPASDKPAAA